MSKLFPLTLKAAAFGIAALVFLAGALPVLHLSAQIVS